jgi:outer membrane lipoprotein-sorting protein
VLVAVAFSIGAFGATQSKAQGVLKEVLDRMDKNYKTLQTVRADITMVKVNDQIGGKDTTSGSVAFISKNFKKKMYARINWTKPVEESVVVIGDQYKLYRPSLQQAIVGSTKKIKGDGGAGGVLAFMSMSKAEIQANYDVKYVGQEGVSGSVQTWHIFMTPRTPTSYKSADLWVDSDGMPRQAMITENNGDTTTIVLAKIKKNDELKTSEFSLDVPKGTKVING